MSDQTYAPMPIAGYLDRLSARPGERIAVKVSAQGGGDYEASLVEVIRGDPNPASGGMKFLDIPAPFAGAHPARDQPIHLGSHAVCPPHPSLCGPILLVSMLVQPWLLRESPSTLMASHDEAGNGWDLEASADALSFQLFRPHGLGPRRHEAPALVPGVGRLRRGEGADSGGLRALRAGGGEPAVRQEAARISAVEAPILIAAREHGLAGQHFNGRIEDPALWSRWPEPATAPDDPDTHHGAALLAWWDFSIEIPTQAIIDRGRNALHGRLVNVPTRAVCGARWTGREMCWRAAPRDYAAIHFHEDDLYDCGWGTDFVFDVPPDMKSGVYAVRLEKGDETDIVPFFVLPPKGKRTADVCYLASTFTYQVYANHARGNYDESMRQRIEDVGAANAHVPDNYPIYGRSTYNVHPDGSGHAYSSRLRPILTMRPGFITFVDERGSGLRHFPADTHLLDWLRAKEIDFDVVTDEDLDDEGLDLIKDYPTVLTGSHPEYHTPGMLDALQGYVDGGGKFVYLGGNGFYWRIARSSLLPGVVEIRRGEGGIRAWSAEPGEYYNSLDGAYGGLWRRNGRPPQRLVGIGFSGQGQFEGSYYRRLPASYAPEAAWIFEGIDEEILGDFGLSGGGAAGFELDRTYRDLGTPDNIMVLARSEGHGASFIPVPEELLTHLLTVSGEARDALMRAEIVYFDNPAGGAVFAVGSITFCGSLPHNDYRNPISRLLENVVRRFSTSD
jgi:N,N-dimethylformamidase